MFMFIEISGAMGVGTVQKDSIKITAIHRINRLVTLGVSQVLSRERERERERVPNLAHQLRVSSPAAAAAAAFAGDSLTRSARIRSAGCRRCCFDCAASPANRPVPFHRLRHTTVVCSVISSQVSDIRSGQA